MMPSSDAAHYLEKKVSVLVVKLSDSLLAAQGGSQVAVEIGC